MTIIDGRELCRRCGKTFPAEQTVSERCPKCERDDRILAAIEAVPRLPIGESHSVSLTAVLAAVKKAMGPE